MDRRPLMIVVAGASLAVSALAGIAALAPDHGSTGFRPTVIARLDVRPTAPVAARAGAERDEPAAPVSTIVLPPLPSNTGPNATYDAPFIDLEESPGGTANPVVPGSDTARVVDDLGMIVVELPASWGAVDTAPAGANPALAAAPDWDRWAEWSASGAVIVAYPTIFDPEPVLRADPLAGHCRAGAVSPFAERNHYGVQQIFTDCNGDHRVTNYVWIVSPPDLAYSLYVNVQLVGADRGVFELIRSTFDTVADARLPSDAAPPQAMTDEAAAV